MIGEIHIMYMHDDERFAVKNKRAYLFAFRIHKDFQGKGYGQILMNEVIDVLRKRGYSEFTIGVEDDNKTAIHIKFTKKFKSFLFGVDVNNVNIKVSKLFAIISK